MVNLIVDSDLGVEPDDAVALALAGALHVTGACRLRAVTASSARRGTVAALRAVLRYYNLTLPVGKLKQPFLDCDQENVYLTELVDTFRENDVADENVRLLGQLLKREACVWVTNGPLTNVADLLTAAPDLFREKIAGVVIMGGHGKSGKWDDTAARNPDAARIVYEQCPCPLTVVPYELGAKIKTGDKFTRGPVQMAVDLAFEKAGKKTSEKKKPFCHGWAPAAILAAVQSELFRYSAPGRLTLTEQMGTRFTPDAGGNARIALAKPKALQTHIERLLTKLP